MRIRELEEERDQHQHQAAASAGLRVAAEEKRDDLQRVVMQQQQLINALSAAKAATDETVLNLSRAIARLTGPPKTT